MDRYVRAALLLEYYGSLLTEKQREVMRLRFEQDLSLGEIAPSMGITRQAVQDIESRSLRKVENLEEHLHLIDTMGDIQRRFEMIAAYAQDIPDAALREKILSLAATTDEELFGSE